MPTAGPVLGLLASTAAPVPGALPASRHGDAQPSQPSQLPQTPQRGEGCDATGKIRDSIPQDSPESGLDTPAAAPRHAEGCSAGAERPPPRSSPAGSLLPTAAHAAVVAVGSVAISAQLSQPPPELHHGEASGHVPSGGHASFHDEAGRHDSLHAEASGQAPICSGAGGHPPLHAEASGHVPCPDGAGGHTPFNGEDAAAQPPRRCPPAAAWDWGGRARSPAKKEAAEPPASGAGRSPERSPAVEMSAKASEAWPAAGEEAESKATDRPVRGSSQGAQHPQPPTHALHPNSHTFNPEP